MPLVSGPDIICASSRARLHNSRNNYALQNEEQPTAIQLFFVSIYLKEIQSNVDTTEGPTHNLAV